MIPIKDENPTIHFTFTTYIIICINVLVWIFVQGMGMNPDLVKSICEYGLIPGELFSMVEPGTKIPLGKELVCVIGGEPNWATVITSMFMHGGWFHLIGNMWFLGLFGDNVEDALGSFRFILFYLLCGMGAVVFQVLSNPSSISPMVGASGAIGGVMGAYAFLYPRAPVHMLVFVFVFFFRIVIPAFLLLGYWFLMQLVSGMMDTGSGGVAFWAHIGGFVTGVFLLKLFCSEKRLKRCKESRRSTGKIFTRYGR